MMTLSETSGDCTGDTNLAAGLEFSGEAIVFNCASVCSLFTVMSGDSVLSNSSAFSTSSGTLPKLGEFPLAKESNVVILAVALTKQK